MPRSTRVFKKKKGGHAGSGRKKISVNICDNNVNSEVQPLASIENVCCGSANEDNSTPASASRKKIQTNCDSVFNDSDVNPSKLYSGNCIVDISLLSEAISSFVLCSVCGVNSVQCYEEIPSRVGLVVSLVLECTNCGAKHSFVSSKGNKKAFFETNMRFVYGLRTIGKGQAAGKTFCAIMDLPQPPSRFQNYFKKINNATVDCANKSMLDAVHEAVDWNEGCTDIAVALDGTWQKRGHTSLHGVVSATSVDTGKVVDVQILTKYCHKCEKLKDEKVKLNIHKCSGECSTNYQGVSGGMESEGVLSIFHRSQEKYNVQYTRYLGDGDTKAYKKVVESKPYGEVNIEKLECVGHVQKRLGSRLRRLRNEYKGKRLEDGKALGGQGRLSEKEIDRLQSYYGQAIRNNLHSLEDMQKAVYAALLHRASTDAVPLHHFCPTGVSSWCKFNKSKVTGENYEHHPLPKPIVDLIKPIYRSLTQEDLLRKCMHGKTQNVNESFNSVIWTRVPKTVFVGSETISIGVHDAVLTFNEGNSGRVKVLELLGVDSGTNMKNAFHTIDSLRVKKADMDLNTSCKEARKLKRSHKRARDDEDNPDDPEYEAGSH